MKDDCCSFCDKSKWFDDCSYKKIENIPNCCASCSFGLFIDHTQLKCSLPDMNPDSDESLVGHLYICDEFKAR